MRLNYFNNPIVYTLILLMRCFGGGRAQLSLTLGKMSNMRLNLIETWYDWSGCFHSLIHGQPNFGSGDSHNRDMDPVSQNH